ncbi:MAG: DUF5000 domain-containing lipoprotein [Mangrovibacterium sp.]
MKNTLIYLTLCLFLFTSCDQAVDVNIPYGDKISPAQVSNVRVKDSYGESVIYYDRPDDPNLKYVKAVYVTDDGIRFDANASYYTDSILINGFGKAGTYDVELYSVSYGEVYSAPVKVPINPLTPPYIVAWEHLTVSPTFGGIHLLTENGTGAKLAIRTFKKNFADDWEEIGMYYTTTAKIDFSVRGQESIETEFGIQVRDRWGHLSEIKSFVLTPFFELKCDKKLFKKEILPTDTYIMHNWGNNPTPTFEYLWDDIIFLNNARCFHTRPTDTMPQHFTIDLGKEYRLSRFVVHGRGEFIAYGGPTDRWQAFYAAGDLKDFELWGSTNPNRTTGTFDESWFKIGDYTRKRADGSTDPQAIKPLTDEDRALILAGHEFIVPDETPKLRWIRLRALTNYGNVGNIYIDELTFYGEPVE